MSVPVPMQAIEPFQVAGIVLFSCLLIAALLLISYDLLRQQEVNDYKKKLADCERRLLREKKPDGEEG